MTRDAVPHGPTSPLSDDQTHPGTRGPSEPSGREIAAEGRAGGPTEGEIEAAARATAALTDSDTWETAQGEWAIAWRDRARVDAQRALAAALPLIEARLREQIAGEIEADAIDLSPPVGPVEYHDGHIDGMEWAARIARGRT